mmetsp:Transcript_19270/g.37846  ORF Transcript_19270/g.37846 Transcript_19270/m.37846 type:complete len:107 (+) Transcript_19270:99-419(+)
MHSSPKRDWETTCNNAACGSTLNGSTTLWPSHLQIHPHVQTYVPPCQTKSKKHMDASCSSGQWEGAFIARGPMRNPCNDAACGSMLNDSTTLWSSHLQIQPPVQLM